ncbi:MULTISPECIES: hypothetical protein [unclassified Caulobacter]|uniref:hypothetical protein n=1 Tax=unclassified Caulobacter TaxID=2648921 RepID=UPI000D366E6D|nr:MULTISPECIES: hypothetical protein [unclassified Caulobacter]PTS87103.1 hypothetical protein DBR21_13575 [Caulobacter sp. HMWF009]PTT10523.1 hypothetical protein DBR10_05310 [Caulobacter sp. HMWF025]
MTVSVTFAMPRARFSPADDLAREIVARVLRVSLVVVGLVLIAGGALIAPLPGPLGLPLTVVGLMLVLRNSFKARKQFVRFQHAHPKLIFPLRRLLRREPEVVLVAWQQALRVERLIIPRRWRVAVRWRKSLKRPR